MTVREAILGLSVAGSAWVLVGYPACLAAMPARPPRRSESLPTVSVIVPAYREREGLRRKLAALRELDYPNDRLEVLVPVDEDEGLVRIAEEAYPCASVLFTTDRGGKALAINRALAVARGDVIVMTDANNVLDAASIRSAVRHLADPTVWAVAGRRGERESAYDRYEDLIRRLEARSGSVAAASGEFMAVLRDRFPRFPEGIVNDDFWLLCQLVRAGGRVMYEPGAVSIEEPLAPRAEHARRSRMGAGRVMLAAELRGLPPAFVFRVLSHKYARLALPFMLLATLTSSLSLARRPPYAALAAIQSGIYALGGLALAGRAPAGRSGRVAKASAQLMLGNASIAIGVLRALRGGQSVRWDPVE